MKEYQELKEHLEKLVSPIPFPFPNLSSPQVGQINGRFSTCRWSPIRYIYGCIPQSQLAGFYRQGRVFLNYRTSGFLNS